MQELQQRLVRGLENLRRAEQGARLVADLGPLPAWADAALAELILVEDEAWLEPAATPEVALALLALREGKPSAEAVRALGPGAILLQPAARAELARSANVRARSDTLRAFYDGVRAWFWMKRLPDDATSASKLMLLAASSGVEPLADRVEIARRRWETRIAQWSREPYTDPLGRVISLPRERPRDC